MLVPKRLRLQKDIITRVYRSLEGTGQFAVQKGQQVSPEEIIGSSSISLGFRTINLAKLLSVPGKEVKKYLIKGLGEKIYQGELLAYKEGGLFSNKKIVTAPTDGLIDFINSSTGELRMNFLPKKINLTAGVFGIIDELDPIKGYLLIQTEVTRIYGVFGTGKIRDGMLVKVSIGDDLVSSSKISHKYAGCILLGGSLVYKEAVSAAISAGIHGIITGGLNAKDFRGMAGGRLIFPKKLDSDIGISLVALEGFGSIPIGDDVYQQLLNFEGKFISMNGNLGIIDLPSYSSNSLIRIKKVSLPKGAPLFDNENDLQMTEIKAGQQVRVIGSSYGGEQGQVISIDQSKTLLTSGLYSSLVIIATKSRKLSIPANNLEII